MELAKDYISLSSTATSDDANFFANTGQRSNCRISDSLIEFDYATAASARGIVGIDAKEAVVADFFSFGFTDDGVQSSERFANQIIRN